MKKLSVLALLVFVGCAGELADSGDSDQPTIRIVNDSSDTSDLALSATADCGAAITSYRAGKSVDKVKFVTVAAGELKSVATGRMTYLCASEDAIGYPITPGNVYDVVGDPNFIVEGEEGR